MFYQCSHECSIQFYVMKSINYFRPDLTQFFTNEELARTKFDNLGI